MEEYPFLSNVNVDHRFIGLETLLSPMAKNTSTQRLSMFAAHLTQAMVLDGGEYPRIASGYENIVSEFQYNVPEIDEDIQIIALLNKYLKNTGDGPIHNNPRYTVIYRGDRTKTINYFHIDTYTQCADGFGYLNILQNLRLLQPGNFIPQGTIFVKSPIQTDIGYGLGINARVAYMSLDGVTKDAFIISESLARKMTSKGIVKYDIDIDVNQIPLNLYGNDCEYKFFPDIGEIVRDDGLLMCIRDIDPFSFIFEVSNIWHAKPQYTSDRCYISPHSHASVIDIDVLANKKLIAKTIPSVFEQLNKYITSDITYCKRVVECYNKAIYEGLEISPAFNTLVTDCIVKLFHYGERVEGFNKMYNVQYMRKRNPVKMIHMRLKCIYDNIVTPGFKISGRDGGKGVVSAIWPDEDMPVDDYGFRADIIATPESIPNRMNPGSLYELFITRTDEFTRHRIRQIVSGHIPPEVSLVEKKITPDYLGAWTYFIEYMREINPNFAKIVEDSNPTIKHKEEQIKEVIHRGIYHIIPPYIDRINIEYVKRIDSKFPAPATPVSFNILSTDGTTKIRVRSKSKVCIGVKYLYTLCKIPHLSAPGVGYINQYKTPIQTNKIGKYMYAISQTPIRAGEDEIRNLTMAVGVYEAIRLITLHANSTEGVRATIKSLLTADKPTCIKRINFTTEYLQSTNNIVGMINHIFETIGIDIHREIPHPEEWLAQVEELLLASGGYQQTKPHVDEEED